MNEQLVRELRQEKLIRLARKDANTFIEFVIKDAQTGELVRQSPMHISWQSHIDYCWSIEKCAGILGHWGSGKTIGIAVARTLFEIGKNPNIRIKLVSNSDDRAKERVSAIKEYIESSEEYHQVFPNIKPDFNRWGSLSIKVVRSVASPDATLTAHGVLSSGIGGRADLLVFDDIVDERNSLLQPRMKAQVKSTFSNTWMGRLESNGRVVNICTRWTMDDITADLLKSPAWLWLIQKIAPNKEYIIEQIVGY